MECCVEYARELKRLRHYSNQSDILKCIPNPNEVYIDKFKKEKISLKPNTSTKNMRKQ